VGDKKNPPPVFRVMKEVGGRQGVWVTRKDPLRVFQATVEVGGRQRVWVTKKSPPAAFSDVYKFVIRRPQVLPSTLLVDARGPF
jgi:hypothetical protein